MKTKNTARFILFTLTTLSAVLLSACSGVSVPVTGDDSNVSGSPSTPVIVDDNGNSSNSNDANSNDNTGSNGNSNDSGVEIVGIVEVITEDTITINGVTYPLSADFTEFRDLVSVGDEVRVRVMINADGTFTILQVEISTGDDNGNDANSNDANSNDDNGGNDNDDDGDNSNDDSGGGNDNDGNDDGGGGNDNGGGSNDNG